MLVKRGGYLCPKWSSCRGIWCSPGRSKTYWPNQTIGLLLANYGPRCNKICQSMSSLSNTWWFHSSATIVTLSKYIVLTLPYMGTRCHRTFQDFLLPRSCVHFNSRRLLFKVGWGHSVKRSGGKPSRKLHQVMTRLAEKYKFKHSFSSSYNPSSNGQAKAFNEVLYKILKKMISRSWRD